MLAELEQLNLIDQSQVELTAKGSKVSWEPDWSENTDVPIETMEREDGSVVQIGKSVELVVKFSQFKNLDRVIRLLSYLNDHVFSNLPGALPGSWDSPDIRITSTLESMHDLFINIDLRLKGYNLVVMNILETDQGKLGVLRKTTGLKSVDSRAWKAVPVIINSSLAKFIQGYGVQD